MNKKNAFTLALSLIAIIAIIFSGESAQAALQPGGAQDPLVTRSYVDSRIAELTSRIVALEQMIQGMAPPAAEGPQINIAEITALVDARLANIAIEYGVVVPFTIHQVQAGQRIFFEAGAEYIVRVGTVMALAGPNGHIDVTAGRDIAHGELIGLNHLILIPQTDGRGVHFHTSGWIMIKGGFWFAE